MGALQTQELRYKVAKADVEIFRQMARADLLEPSAFLQWLIREEGTRRGIWPLESDEGNPAAHRRGVPPPPPIVMVEREK